MLLISKLIKEGFSSEKRNKEQTQATHKLRQKVDQRTDEMKSVSTSQKYQRKCNITLIHQRFYFDQHSVLVKMWRKYEPTLCIACRESGPQGCTNVTALTCPGMETSQLFTKPIFFSSGLIARLHFPAFLEERCGYATKFWPNLGRSEMYDF